MKSYPLNPEEVKELDVLDKKYPKVHFVHVIQDIEYGVNAGVTVAWYRNYPNSRLIYFTVSSLNPTDTYIRKRGRLLTLKQIDEGKVLNISVGDRYTSSINNTFKRMFTRLVLT